MSESIVSVECSYGVHQGCHVTRCECQCHKPKPHVHKVIEAHLPLQEATTDADPTD